MTDAPTAYGWQMKYPPVANEMDCSICGKRHETKDLHCVMSEVGKLMLCTHCRLAFQIGWATKKRLLLSERMGKE